jgi:hypothetical protein
MPPNVEREATMVDTGHTSEFGLSDANQVLPDNGSVVKLLLGIAAFALGQALQLGNGFITTPAIAGLTIALICAGESVATQRLSFSSVSYKALWVVFVTGLMVQIIELLMTLPGVFILPTYLPQLWWYQVYVAIGGVCALLSLAPRTWFSGSIRVILIVTVFLAVLSAGVWVIRASPQPFIDVYIFEQTSSQALLRGQNPYELTPPNIYSDTNSHGVLYGAELVKDGKMTIGNPYPPLSIYLSFLGYVVAGDIRYSHLAAVLVASLLLICLRPSREALLAAYLLLFTPRVFFVIEQSWTEPLVLLCAVALIWCLQHRPTWSFIALGLLIAIKQYMIFFFPLIVWLVPLSAPKKVWLRSGFLTLATAFLVTAPLAFWNLPAFLWNVGWAQWYQVFRFDALSYAALYATAFGQKPSQLLSFVVLGMALLFFWRYSARSSAGFATALGVGLGLFFAFSKQAFCNYYFLVIGLLCCALAALPTSDNLFTINK